MMEERTVEMILDELSRGVGGHGNLPEKDWAMVTLQAAGLVAWVPDVGDCSGGTWRPTSLGYRILDGRRG